MYKIGKRQKELIAQNLINIVENCADVLRVTEKFVGQWVCQNKRTPTMIEIWDYVLKNHLPKERPILYRVCHQVENDRISSFTGSWTAINKLRHNRPIVIICDTKEEIDYAAKYYKKGEYKYTFYPLWMVLKRIDEKYKGDENCTDSQHIGEKEYVMKEYSESMSILRWDKEK